VTGLPVNYVRFFGENKPSRNEIFECPLRGPDSRPITGSYQPSRQDYALIRRIPIAKKLLMMVLTTSASLSTVLTCAQIAFEYQEKKSELTSVIKGVESSLLPGIARLIWDYDVNNIAPPFDNLMNSVDLSYVKIINSEGKVVLEKNKADFTPRFPIPVKFPVVYRDGPQPETVGQIEMIFYSDRILREIRFHFVTLLAFNLVKTLLVAMILIQLFGRVVTRPLTGVVKYLTDSRNLPEGKRPDDLMIQRGATANDEITDLIEFVSAREREVFELQRKLREKIQVQSRALEETDLALRQEKIRAEMNARMAQMAEMASGVAHEINNPLAIISGYLFAIKAEVKKPEPAGGNIVKSVESAQKTVERIAKIITGLRTFARDASKDPKAPTQVHAMISDAVNLLESKIRGHGVGFELVNECPDTVTLTCRSSQITQCLVALISNAFDAIKGRENAWIKLTVRQSESNILIRFVDSGQGIPDDVASKMFDPFFTTKEVGHGAGLGLSFSLGVARDHGGDLVYVKESPNTAFELRLPL
jgi:signal transduction histidine kinase